MTHSTDYDRTFLRFFSESFAEARSKFVAAAAGATGLWSFPHPLAGPDGDALATEVALFGPADADQLLVVVSATHGVEGWAGSACQIGWMKSGMLQRLPEGVAVLLVHAINPWGMAWDRRGQEDNVDLNRHFVDFANLPDDSAFRALYPSIMCRAAAGPERELARQTLADYRERHGNRAFMMALYAGQYSHADSISYGGTAPVWSRTTIDRIFDAHCRKARKIVVCDIHTGYGPYGYGIPLWHMEAGPRLDEARRLFGPTTEAPLTGDRSQEEFIQHGHFYGYCEERLAPAEVIAMCMEFGGVWVGEDGETNQEFADQLAWLDGDPLSPEARAGRRAWREIHCPSTDDWREMVWMRGRQLLRELTERMAAAGPASGPSVHS